MTKEASCRWCGTPLPKPSGPGRPRWYCRRSHRQRAYEARIVAERRGIGPDEVLFSRRVWDALRDALYRLQTAAEDAAMDTSAARATKADYIEAVAHLTAAVGDLAELTVEPVALHDARDTSQ